MGQYVNVGISPIFELIDDHGLDDDQKKKALKKYEKELNELIDYDKKIHFEKKLRDAITMTMVFGYLNYIQAPTETMVSF